MPCERFQFELYTPGRLMTRKPIHPFAISDEPKGLLEASAPQLKPSPSQVEFKYLVAEIVSIQIDVRE